MLIIPLLYLNLNFMHIKLFFHTHPRIPLTFSLNLPRDSSKSCIATYSNSLPPHTHYSDQDLNPFLVGAFY